MNLKCFSVLLCVFVIKSVCYVLDPCKNYNVITDTARAPNFKLNLERTNAFTDDRLNPGWYRIQSDVGEYMPTRPPDPFMCNTWYPIWFNGTFPNSGCSIATGNACLRSFYATCNKTWTILIKKCEGNFLVYELEKSPVIDSGYCFGKADFDVEEDIADNCNRTTVVSSIGHKMTSTMKTDTTEEIPEISNKGLSKTKDIYVDVLVALLGVCIFMVFVLIVIYSKQHVKKKNEIKQVYISDTKCNAPKNDNPLYLGTTGNIKPSEAYLPAYSSVDFLKAKNENIPVELFRA